MLTIKFFLYNVITWTAWHWEQKHKATVKKQKRDVQLNEWTGKYTD